MTALSILTITKGEPSAWPFIEALRQVSAEVGAEFAIFHDDRAFGCLEDVHDRALEVTTGDYILRVDDDEACSPALVAWLKARAWEAEDHWKFARAALWGDAQTLLATPQLWPDHQTRLSVRAKAGGRTTIHAGSPFGGGALAPACLTHHKFLIKSYAERRAIADRYDTIRKGAGRQGGMTAFGLPEDAYGDTAVPVAHLGTGIVSEIDAQIADGTASMIRLPGYFDRWRTR